MCSPLLAAGACEVQRFVCLLAHPCQFRSQALMELVYKVLENIMEQVSFLYLVSCSWTYNDEEGCQESSHPSCLSKEGFAAWRKTVWSESESTGCWSSGHRQHTTPWLSAVSRVEEEHSGSRGILSWTEAREGRPRWWGWSGLRRGLGNRKEPTTVLKI